MSDELQELWVRCRHLEALIAELLAALEECANDTQLDLRVADKARAAITRAKEQK